MITDNVIPLFPQRPDSERTAEKAMSDKHLMQVLFGPLLPEGMEEFFENDDDSGPEAA